MGGMRRCAEAGLSDWAEVGQGRITLGAWGGGFVRPALEHGRSVGCEIALEAARLPRDL